MTHSISSGWARSVLDPLEYNNQSANHSSSEQNNDHVMGE